MTLTLTPRAVSSSIAGIPASVAGTLIITLGRARRLQSVERLLDGGRGVVGEVGRALERDEAVAPVAGVVGGRSRSAARPTSSSASAKNSSCGSRDAGGDGGAELVVVAVGAGDRLGEDRGVRGRAGHRAVGDQRARTRRCRAARARACRARSRRRRRAAAWRRFMPRSRPRRGRAPRAARRDRRGAGRRRRRARG